ncbi:hypothetical protein [Cellulomonas shaoxiangyii]|uniref:DUF998 domain-containing protein n=1 Tax=Cellulomonas shaoxiangyii TaxID=2566013 RepID=A0A4P7SIK9_9CELL|nr:hypothetical protein [Cellulomonas shaoxiangyii]QCB93478.1 hypothetical protein E5225_07805 [Cellulomonas shaoxiangyii]TGY86800.1 hypothetical protein E5226_00125 [Cellulomonas shaoxiangyii]
MSSVAPDDVAAQRRAVRDTYRSLRLGLVALVVLLGAAVTLEAVAAGCWQTSVSAYYWTGAHDALVGGLCAIGAVLLAYRDTSELENTALDVAGALALVVALTPTSQEPTCGGAGVPVAALDVVPGVRTGIGALIVAGVLAAVVRLAVRPRVSRTRLENVVRVAAGVLLAGLGSLFLLDAERFATTAHDLAAVGLFLATAAVVLLRGFAARAVSARWGYAYSALGVTLVLALATVVALRATVPTWRHAVLVTEAALIALFAAFWVLRTIELWGADAPPPRGPARARRGTA